MEKIAGNGAARGCKTCGAPHPPLRPGDTLPKESAELVDGAFRGMRGLYDRAELRREQLVADVELLRSTLRSCTQLFELGQNAWTSENGESFKRAQTLMTMARAVLRAFDQREAEPR